MTQRHQSGIQWDRGGGRGPIERRQVCRDSTRRRSLYDYAQLVTGGDERLLDILAGVGLGEDET